MDGNNPAQQRETLEQPASTIDSGIETLKRAAKEIVEKDPNSEYTSRLASMDVLNPSPKDREAVTFMQSELINIMAKIAKKIPDSNLKDISPRNLSEITKRSGVQLRSSEVIALSKLDELQMHTENPTSVQLNTVWGAMVEKAEEAKIGFKEKTINWIKKNPGSAVALGVGGAFGLYFGFKLLKWAAGEVKDAAKDQIKSFFSPGKWIGLGVIAAGAYWGKDIMKKIYEQLGIPQGLEKVTGDALKLKTAVEELSGKIEKLSKITDPEERAKLEQEILEWKKKVDDIASKGGIKPGEIIEKSKETLDEIRWKAVRPEGVPQEERERATRLSGFIKGLNTSFDIDPQLIAAIGSMKYKEAINDGGGVIGKAAHAAQMALKGDFEEAKKIVFTHSPEEMMEFLKKVLINNGNIEEFKNKSVYEILEIIEKDRDKYIDGKELNRLQLEKQKTDKIAEMTNRLIAKPELWNDKDFQHEWSALQTESAMTSVLTLSKKASLLIYEKGVPILKAEFGFLHGTLEKLGENLIKRDDTPSKTFGYYLLAGGALTASCGATLGTAMGIGKAFATGRPFVTYGAWRIGVETVEYGWRGLKLPLEALLTPIKAAYNYKEMGVTPMQMAKRFFQQEISHPIEEIKYKTFIKKRGLTSTLIEKVKDGKLKMKTPGQLNDVVWKLQNQLEDLESELEGMKKIRKPSLSEKTQITNLKNDIKKYEKLLDAFTEEKEMKRSLFQLKKTESLAKYWNQGKYESWVKTNLASLNETQLNAVLKNPKLGCMILVDSELIKDPIILKALEGEDHLEIEKIILKRVKELGKMSKAKIAEAAKASAAATKSAGEVGAAKDIAGTTTGSSAEAPKTGETAVEVAAKTETGEITSKATKPLAEAATDDLSTLAKASTPEEIAAKTAVEGAVKDLQALEEAQRTAKTAEAGSDAVALARTEDTATKSVKAAVEAIEATGKTSKLAQTLQVLKFAGKVGGVGMAVTGTVISGYEMVSAFHEAATTSDSDRRNILIGKGGMYGANLIAGGAGTYAIGASLLGSTTVAGGAAATLGWAALPLIPLTYMGEGVVESMYERTKTIDEWRSVDHKQLIHDWITTSPLTANDTYRVFSSTETIDREKHDTQEKIVAAILNTEENIKPGKPANPDRMYYIKTVSNFSPPFSYEAGLQLLRDSKTYADIMMTRRIDIEKKEKNPDYRHTVGKIELTDARFENPDNKAIQELMVNFKNYALENIDKDLRHNFDQFTDNYLVDLYCQSISYVNNLSEDVTEDDAKFAFSLRNYLVHQRNINVEAEYLKWLSDLAEKGMSEEGFKQLKEKVRQNIIGFQKNPGEALKEDLNNRPNQAENALYKVAKYFGYTGKPKEAEMKKFFDEKHKDAFGIYWNGEEWYVNDNYGSDDKMGKELNAATISGIIKEFKEDWKDIFAARGDAVVDAIPLIGTRIGENFEYQAQNIAYLLGKGLKEKLPNSKELSPAIHIENEERLAS